MAFAVDSTHPIAPAVLAQHGVDSIIRYAQTGSRPSWKSMLPSEQASYGAAGISTGIVWEVSTNDIDGGAPAGTAYARMMCAFLDALGYPKDRLAAWSEDKQGFTGEADAFADAWHGFAKSTGRDADAYASKPVIDRQIARGTIVEGWQTESSSWSPGPLSPNVTVLQTVATPIPGTDGDKIIRPTRLLWGPAGSTPASPAVPVWHAPTFPDETINAHAHPDHIGSWAFMLLALGKRGFNHATLTQLQTWGPGKALATQQVQRDHDVILLLGGVTDRTAYWGDGILEHYSAGCGPKEWAFACWEIGNLKAGGN